jgi:HEPN domain-containing protein
MRDPKEVAEVVREWVLKAENDLTNAVHTLKLGAECPTDTVGFHAQQCVEKYLKALLVFLDIDFPKTHDIEELVALLPRRKRAKMSLAEKRRLTRYATVGRYPRAPLVSLVEARKAVALARQIRREVRQMLPRAALRRKKK